MNKIRLTGHQIASMHAFMQNRSTEKGLVEVESFEARWCRYLTRTDISISVLWEYIVPRRTNR